MSKFRILNGENQSKRTCERKTYRERQREKKRQREIEPKNIP